MSSMHNILLLAFPNGQLLDIAGPLQMFAGANDELRRPFYRIEIAAPHAGPFPTSSGVQLVANIAFEEVTDRSLVDTHTLLTVGGEPGMRHELQRGAVTSIVSRAVGRVPRIASVCSGTFFLAAAGIHLTQAEPVVRILSPPAASLRTIGSAVGRMVVVSDLDAGDGR